MCSWCWAFRPALSDLLASLPKEISLVRLLGGLAPDSEAAMPEAMRAFVQGHWRIIEQRVPGTIFNHDFWHNCEPRRSTYPACRAVIAARNQGREFDAAMTLAIQQAYYLQARNPSDYSTLIAIAEESGLDKNKFTHDITSSETDQVLQQEIHLTRQLGLHSFPGLLVDNGEAQSGVAPDYLNAGTMLEKINHYL